MPGHKSCPNECVGTFIPIILSTHSCLIILPVVVIIKPVGATPDVRRTG
eukprot:SAG11_NODE_23034_length_396_cov_0.824916_1_plen_48_part_10